MLLLSKNNTLILGKHYIKDKVSKNRILRILLGKCMHNSLPFPPCCLLFLKRMHTSYQRKNRHHKGMHLRRYYHG